MKKTTLLFFAVASALLWGCRPEGPEYIDDLDLVITNYDKKANFSSKLTYSVSDSIVKLFTANFSDPDGDSMPDFVKANVAAQIIAKVDANMSAYGYTKVGSPQAADVTLLLSVLETTTLYYAYDYWYWGWYYPWYPYYPYYPTVVASSKSGTLMMQMVSNVDRNDDDRVPTIWNSVFNGLLEGSNAEINARINKSIDQSFTQSPYLKH